MFTIVWAWTVFKETVQCLGGSLHILVVSTLRDNPDDLLLVRVLPLTDKSR